MDDKGCQSGHFLFVFSLGKLLIYGLSSRIRTATADRSADFENWLRNELIPGQAPQLLEALESVRLRSKVVSKVALGH